VSIAIVILLGATGIAIWWNGQHYDQGRFALRTEALNSTVDEVVGKAATIRVASSAATLGSTQVSAPSPERTESVASATAPQGESETYGDYSAAEAGATPAPATSTAGSEQGAPLDVSVPDLVVGGPTEFYNTDTLYEKINGRAPAYQEFNFQTLRARTFRPAMDDGSYVDVLEFRMENPVGAFGIFATERDDTGKPVDFVPEGYASEMGYFFRKGAFYVQVIASDANVPTMKLAEAVARAHAGSIAVDDTGLAARRRLPEQDLVAGSVAYVQSDALGMPFLKDVFQAKYKFQNSELPFFVMAGASDDIGKAFVEFKTFSGKYGKVTKEASAADGTPYFLAESFGKFRAIFQRPDVIGGVFDAGDAAAAEAFVLRYLGSVRTETSK
jgi:hypothetical protein